MECWSVLWWVSPHPCWNTHPQISPGPQVRVHSRSTGFSSNEVTEVLYLDKWNVVFQRKAWSSVSSTSLACWNINLKCEMTTPTATHTSCFRPFVVAHVWPTPQRVLKRLLTGVKMTHDIPGWSCYRSTRTHAPVKSIGVETPELTPPISRLIPNTGSIEKGALGWGLLSWSATLSAVIIVAKHSHLLPNSSFLWQVVIRSEEAHCHVFPFQFLAASLVWISARQKCQRESLICLCIWKNKRKWELLQH